MEVASKPSVGRRGKIGSVKRGMWEGERDWKKEVISRCREMAFTEDSCVQNRTIIWVWLVVEVEGRYKVGS